MIRLLEQEDWGIVEGLSGSSFAALRIRSTWRAYGTGYPFLRFYATEDGGTVLCVQEGLAVLWTKNREKDRLVEAAEFLPFTAETFLTEAPLPLEGYRTAQGNAYCHRGGLSLPGTAQSSVPSISHHLEEGFGILSRVFPTIFLPHTYPQWYADLSHRIRHGVSEISILEGACVAVRYGMENGWLGISQLATLPEYRGRGLAARLLAHMAAASLPEAGILVQSQSPESNRFYEKLGFSPCGSWYTYTK